MRHLLFRCCVFLSLIGSPALAAEPPKTLALEDLVGRPDRWPATVTVSANVRSKSGQTVLQGQRVPVVNVTDKGVFVRTTSGGQIGLFPAQCDLLQQANQRWARLTPKQRALTAETVLSDSSLWPETVRLVSPTQVKLPSGATRVLPAGHPCQLLYFHEGNVGVIPSGVPELKWFTPDLVDVVGGAIDRIELDAAARPSVLVESLRGIMKDAEGKPHTAAAIDRSRYFVFFWGANWCGWCHKVSPELASFVNRHREQLRDVTIVMLNGDKQDTEMLKYLREKQLPWPGVRLADWSRVPYFSRTHEGSYPQLLITDRFGRIVYNGFGGGPENIRDHLAAMAKVTRDGVVWSPARGQTPAVVSE